MALFRRKKSGEDGADKPKNSWKKPANTAFRQQRLKAWQPILTPKTVLPTLFIVGLLFAPIGGLLIWGSNKVTKITIDYTHCDTKATSSFSPVEHYSYDLRSSDSGKSHSVPQWSFVNNTANPVATQAQCTLRFTLPADLEPPVFMYYKLTSFYQNHRRYVKSYDADQLRGKHPSASTLNNGDCKPLAKIGDKIVYPCGLIANSIFNDTFTLPIGLSDGNATYPFTDKGIAWSSEKNKYTNDPGYTDLSQLVPPPNWYHRYGSSYNSTEALPKLKDDEHFQNWMRTAGLPTFTKLYYRNDGDVMKAGEYEISVYMNFPVTPYGGTKSIVISTVAWVGGKNPFMGWAYVATAILFVVLGMAGTVRHLLSPRKLGDMSLLSWNQPGAGSGSGSAPNGR